MRILQLTGDWKWTGPAEPMVQLAVTLRGRGHEVDLACPLPPSGEDDRGVAREAARRGVEPVLGLEPGRGLRPLRDAGTARRLRRLLEERRHDVVHAWHTRDHTLALRAAGWRERGRRAALVRSWRKAEPPPRFLAGRWLFGPGADGVLCVSPGAARAARALRGRRALAGCFGAVDLERFSPRAPDPEVRRGLGLEPDALVVGIVARVQPHRRFDLLLDAAARVLAAEPRARLLVVGRGTRREALAEAPARRLGITDRVVFAGHRGADYADVVRAIDVFTFLVPGSDGTCRALLEAAACGLPAVTLRRGALAEIVADGETGLLADETPEALASAWLGLLRDRDRRHALGAAARKRAEAHFAPGVFAAAVEDLYQAALAGRA